MITDEILQQLAADPGKVLNQGYRIQQRILARQARIQKWRKLAESITANTESPFGGGNYPTSKIENCVAQIVELEDILAEEVTQLMEQEKLVSAIIIEYADKPNHKAVLELRYLNHMTFEEIAVQLVYTFRWTQELLKRAVSEVQEKAKAELEAREEKAR